MNVNRWKSLSFSVSEKKGPFSCSSPGGRGGGEAGGGGGGWNICVRLHSRSIFMMPLRAVESVSLSSVTVGHCVGWNISATVKHCCSPLGLLCSARWWTDASTLGVRLWRCTLYKLTSRQLFHLVWFCSTWFLEQTALFTEVRGQRSNFIHTLTLSSAHFGSWVHCCLEIWKVSLFPIRITWRLCENNNENNREKLKQLVFLRMCNAVLIRAGHYIDIILMLWYETRYLVRFWVSQNIKGFILS